MSLSSAETALHAGKDARLYLDHAATTPMVQAARMAMMDALATWANPSSPHAEGRFARAALEGARRKIASALVWQGAVIFTSGASEAIAIALNRTKAGAQMLSPIEHDAVLRCASDAAQLAVDTDGRVIVDQTFTSRALVAVQHVNNETGVIQPIAQIARAVHATGGVMFVDCAQSAGKIDLPEQADMIALSGHKFGGPPGVGALLVRDLNLLHPSGGQEQGYRGGTENVPAVLAMAAALDEDRHWMGRAAALRTQLDDAIRAQGGDVVAGMAQRLPTIASYRMPGVSARAQLIQFDGAGISVSAGAACSSGTLKTSPVLRAMGWTSAAADEVIRVSFGPQTNAADIVRLIDKWREIAKAAKR